MGANAKFLDDLFSRMAVRSFAEGDMIIRTGEIGKELYFILTGEVSVQLAGGTEVPLNQGLFGDAPTGWVTLVV